MRFHRNDHRGRNAQDKIHNEERAARDAFFKLQREVNEFDNKNQIMRIRALLANPLYIQGSPDFYVESLRRLEEQPTWTLTETMLRILTQKEQRLADGNKIVGASWSPSKAPVLPRAEWMKDPSKLPKRPPSRTDGAGG